jgi:hypothetical protein
MPAPSATIDPNFQVPPTILGQVLTSLLDKIVSSLTTFMNTSVQLGRHLYVELAAISFILAVLLMLTFGEFSLHRFIGLAYWRVLETGIWLSIISYTWKGPFGLPGWFSAVLIGFAQIGATIGHVTLPGTDIQNWNMDMLPGTIADMGVGLFSSIMATVSFGQGGLLGWAAGILDGKVIASACLWIFALFSAVYALAVCVSIALRFFWIFVKAFVLGLMSFIQGLAGSQRLSGLAGSFLNSSLVLGLEVCLTIIMVGLPYHFIMGLIQVLGFGNAVLDVSTAPVMMGPILDTLASTVMTAGALVILNIVLSIWAYAVFRVPRDLAELFAGRINVSQQEIRHAFSSSPLAGAGAVGGGLGMVDTGAREGLGGMAKSAGSAIAAPFMKIGQMSAMGMMAGGGAENGGAEGAMSGAVRGFAMGGPEGAVAGAIAGAVMGGINQRRRQDAEEGGSISGDEAEGDQEMSPTRASSSSQTGEGGRITSEAADGDDVGGDGEAVAAATKARTVNIEDNVNDIQGDAGAAGGGDAPDVHKRRRVQIDDDIVTRLNAAAAALQRGASAMEAAAAGSSAGGGGGKPASRTSSGSNILDQLQTDMSTGDMLMRRFIYSNSQKSPPPGPVPDHEGASMNIPVTLGPK